MLRLLSRVWGLVLVALLALCSVIMSSSEWQEVQEDLVPLALSSVVVLSLALGALLLCNV